MGEVRGSELGDGVFVRGSDPHNPPLKRALSHESLHGSLHHLDETTTSDEVISFKLFNDPTPFDGTSPYTPIKDGKYYVYPHSHESEHANFIRDIFATLDDLLDLDFVEVGSTSEADISIYRSWHNSYWDEYSGKSVLHICTSRPRLESGGENGGTVML